MKSSKTTSTDGMADLLAPWTNKILLCRTKKGKVFSAKLVGLNGNQLFFEDAKKNIYMDSLESLVDIRPLLDPMEKALEDQLRAEEMIEEAHASGDDGLTDEEYEQLARDRKGI